MSTGPQFAFCPVREFQGALGEGEGASWVLVRFCFFLVVALLTVLLAVTGTVREWDSQYLPFAGCGGRCCDGPPLGKQTVLLLLFPKEGESLPGFPGEGRMGVRCTVERGGGTSGGSTLFGGHFDRGGLPTPA